MTSSGLVLLSVDNSFFKVAKKHSFDALLDRSEPDDTLAFNELVFHFDSFAKNAVAFFNGYG